MVTRYIGPEVTHSTLITSYSINTFLTGGFNTRHIITYTITYTTASEISKALNDRNSCS